MALVRACKTTSAHTLPSINLMKNSASELYTKDHSTSYQHAFGYIRQLAMLLRNGLKAKTKVWSCLSLVPVHSEATDGLFRRRTSKCITGNLYIVSTSGPLYSQERATTSRRLNVAQKASFDRSSILLFKSRSAQSGKIVSMTLRTRQFNHIARLIPNARSYPYHMHLTRSLLHLTQHTAIYIPLSPSLLSILTSQLASTSSASKGSTLRPLDFEVTLRAPQQYLKTRVYSEGLAEETTFLLAEHLASAPVHSKIGRAHV